MEALFGIYGLIFLLSLVPTSLPSRFYADNGLEQTVILDVDKIHGRGKIKREMQQEILTLLGLHQRPKPSTHGKTDSAPKFMLDLYNTLQTDSGEVEEEIFTKNPTLNATVLGNLTKNIQTINSADMIMSFVNHVSPGHRVRHDRDRRFYFDFSEVSPLEVITGAEIRVFKQPTPQLDNRTYTITIYRMVIGPDAEDRLLQFEDSSSVSGSQDGWLEINVTSAAIRWQMAPSTNLGLYMTVTDERGHEVKPHQIGLVGRKGSDDHQAFMVAFFRVSRELHTQRTRAARKKRSAAPYTEEDGWKWGPEPYWKGHKRACQRKHLYVSFRDLGWQDWIIAPDGYAAFYCHGECSFPLNAHMNATNHAIVQTLVHLMDPYAVPKPCCAPTKLSAISVLFFDDNSNVILKKYRNMVVRSCGCH